MSNCPDADYLMSDEIGLVIAKGMQVLYKTNPKNPVDFLAKWLLNTSQVQRAAQAQKDEQLGVQASEAQHTAELNEKARIHDEELKAKEREEAVYEQFRSQIDMSNDLTDQLQDLNDHLERGTRATAVYIGKMEQPFKPISESDNDRAHIDKNAPHHIRFCHANKDHSFLVDEILEPTQGLTFEVFDDSQPSEGDESKNQRVEEDDEGNPVPPIQPNEGEVLPKFLVIPEVVREAKMYFYKVPRLGSYMAIRLEY